MADILKISQLCLACNGTKQILDPNWNQNVQNPEERPYISCPKCNNTGYVEWGKMEEVSL
jgi:hypothetical protein